MLSKRSTARLSLGATLALFVSMMWIVLAGAREVPTARPASGFPAPDFSLADISGNPVTLSGLHGRPLLLVFSSVRCPASAEYTERISRFANALVRDQQASVLAIESNLADPTAASLDEVRVNARLAGRDFPTLIDRTGDVARQYQLQATPTLFVIDPAGVVRYAGPFDDNRDAALAKSHYCQQAMEAVLAGKPERVIITQALDSPNSASR